jgi:hypothetical protein
VNNFVTQTHRRRFNVVHTNTNRIVIECDSQTEADAAVRALAGFDAATSSVSQARMTTWQATASRAVNALRAQKAATR